VEGVPWSYGFVGTTLVVRGALGQCIYPPTTLRRDGLKVKYCRVCGSEVLADLKLLADDNVSARHWIYPCSNHARPVRSTHCRAGAYARHGLTSLTISDTAQKCHRWRKKTI
jgi:hypothetical protein